MLGCQIKLQSVANPIVGTAKPVLSGRGLCGPREKRSPTLDAHAPPEAYSPKCEIAVY